MKRPRGMVRGLVGALFWWAGTAIWALAAFAALIAVMHLGDLKAGYAFSKMVEAVFDLTLGASLRAVCWLCTRCFLKRPTATLN